jgi:hypothetical protein
MRRRPRASSKLAKTRRRKAVTLKRRNPRKVARRPIFSAANLHKKVGLLTRELDEAHQRLGSHSRCAQGHKPLDLRSPSRAGHIG